MQDRENVTSTTDEVVDDEPIELSGRTSEADGVVLLQCFAERHKLAEIHPGNMLKIKDRRCKITFVFNLNAILQLKREDAAA